MEIAVTDIKDTKIEGVTVLREETEPYRENYFEWADATYCQFSVIPNQRGNIVLSDGRTAVPGV